jgi:hydroxymethylpyrimidine pyrophosphatase-like HAD family hydrolase
MKIIYKALMLDLDGTTIKNQKDAIPSDKVIQAIGKAKEKVGVGVVTSRPALWALPVIKILSLNAPCVVAGGAQIIDPITNNIVWEKRIPQDEAEKICSILIDLKIPFVGPKKSRNLRIRPGFKIAIPKEGQLEIGIPDIDEKKIALIRGTENSWL